MSHKDKKKILGPVSIGMVFLGFMIFGFMSMLKINYKLFPEVVFPGLTISVENHGQDVYDIEKIITIPLEDAISGIGGIESINSYIERGKSEINVEFKSHSNLDLKSLEIREAIDPVVSLFPRNIHKPVVYKYDPEERPAIVITLNSKRFDFIELRNIAEHEFKQHLEGIDGISKILISGGRVREVVVLCDMFKLREYGLDLQDIQKAIYDQNLSSTIAKLNMFGKEKSVLVQGKFESLNELEMLALYSKKIGSIIRLHDVAEVHYSYRDDENGARLNGRENVSIYVYKDATGNLLKISEKVDQYLNSTGIKGVSVHVIYDQAIAVKEGYYNVLIYLFSGIALLGIFVIWENSILTQKLYFLMMFQLIFSFLLFCLYLYLVQKEFDIIVFSGLIIGFSVNILFPMYEWFNRRNNKSQLILSRERIYYLVILLIVSYFPFYYFDRETGLVSLKLGSFILFYILIARVVENPFNQLLNLWIQDDVATGKHFALGFNWDTSYLSKYRFRYYKLVYILIILFSLAYFYKIPKEIYFTSESSKLIGFIELPSGTGFSFTNTISEKIEKKILHLPQVYQLSSKIDSDHAFMIIELKEGIVGNEEMIEKIKQEIGNTSPAFCYFSNETDAKNFKEITIDVMGNNMELLDSTVRKLADYSKGLAGVQEVVLRYKSPRDELKLFIEEEKVQSAGLSSMAVGNTLQMAIQGVVVSKFMEENSELDIRLRYSEKFRNSKKSLSEMFIKSSEEKFIPLQQVSYMEESTSPVKIYRKNKKRSLSYSIRAGQVSYDDLYKKIQNYAQEIMPEDYSIEITRNMERILEMNREFIFFTVVLVVLLFMSIASYYESFQLASLLLVVASLPLAITITLLELVYGKLDLAMFLGILFVLPITIVQIVSTGRRNIVYSSNAGQLILLFLFFMPQIFFAEGAGLFVKKLELTIIVGLVLSHFIIPYIALLYIRESAVNEANQNNLFIEKKILDFVKKRFFNFLLKK